MSKLNDPYIKFFRWATDRLGERDGIVCFVTNNSFVEQVAFDGVRKHLLRDFTAARSSQTPASEVIFTDRCAKIVTQK